MRGGTLTKPTVSDLLEKENARVSAMAKSDADNNVVVSGGTVPQAG